MTSETKVKISGGGRVVIPAAFRKALHLKEGDELILRLENEELRLLSTKQAIRKAQETVNHYVQDGRSLADELIAERKEEYRIE